MQNTGKKDMLDLAWSGLTMAIGYPVVFLITLLTTFSFARAKESVTGESGKVIVREWGESIVIAFVAAMLIRAFLVEPFKIPSGSMRMTLIEGDRLFVPKVEYGPLLPLTKYRLPGFVKPKRGDVIVFRYPVTRDKDFIKRLIAFGGETVQIKNGKVIINGKEITDKPIADIHYYNMGTYGAEGKTITVPAGNYFVMGDNSQASYDSRFWGFVPEELVIGKAECVFWPLNRIRWIK